MALLRLGELLIKIPPHRFGPGYDAPLRTERAAQKDDSIAKTLLRNAAQPRVVGLDETVDISSGKERFVVLPKEDNRPLIDQFHEATFTEPIGLQWYEHKYDLRMTLRKAHCFTLDTATSAMIADFSLAIAPDLESARQLALPPFPVTWIEFDNVARLQRIKTLGGRLTPTAAGETKGPPTDRVGWLIHPGQNGGYYATYVTKTNQGVVTSPLSWWWQSGKPNPLSGAKDRDTIARMVFNMKETNVSPYDAFVDHTPFHGNMVKSIDYREVRDLMEEIAGELRHVWGFLIALGAGHMGITALTSPQARPEGPPPLMKNGKPLLPLEHKVLHLHLGRRKPGDVITRVISHHKMRQHEVRGHWRLLKSGKRVPVKPHTRGDERLGRITKHYKIEK